MYPNHKNSTRELLGEVQRHLPAGPRFAQEAFTSERRRPVFIKLSDLTPENFYVMDEVAVHAFRNAVVELATRGRSGRLTLSFPSYGEFLAHRPRLRRIVSQRGYIRVLVNGPVPVASTKDDGIDFFQVTAGFRARYSLAMNEGVRPLLFICRECRWLKAIDHQRHLGFFSVDGSLIEEIAEEVELLVRGLVTTLGTFERLEALHQTTQRIARELESYSRRMELAARRARRRPDLLTARRFNRIVGQAVAKMEQLQEIPRRALQTMERTRNP